jgi:molecular chaperone DnaK
VLRAVEAAKRELSAHPFTRIEEEFIAEKDGRALHLSMELGREEYEEMIMPLIERTMDCVRRALEDARLTASAIDKVVLVGGSTRTPLVSRLLDDRLGQAPHQEVNPDLCVAMGAAIQAALIGGADVGAVLVDITPHSLGIKCLEQPSPFSVGGYPFKFAPILHRNTPLPTSQSEPFCTVADNQREVEIEVYQGEDPDPRRNHRIGRFRIEGLAQVPAGNPLVVQLDLNLDGMLKVSAREKATGLQKQITIDNALARYEAEEHEAARERLDQLWGESAPAAGAEEDEIVPELVAGPREGQRETVQARALLEKAERLLPRTATEDRGDIERLMERVRTALTDRKWEPLGAACNELSDVLFYLEDA